MLQPHVDLRAGLSVSGSRSQAPGKRGRLAGFRHAPARTARSSPSLQGDWGGRLIDWQDNTTDDGKDTELPQRIAADAHQAGSFRVQDLVDIDLRFGPFTCMIGPNGSGKSNVFDAIRFLHALSDHTLMEAAASVRDQDSRTADVRSLFHRSGDRYAERICFAAEMIVQAHAVDDLGQEARASITFLRCSLELAYRPPGGALTPGSLEIIKEELTHIPQGAAARHFPFPHRARDWRRSVVKGQRRAHYFISTEDETGQRVIKLHQDGGSRGRPLRRSATHLPRTVLSAANSAESPTVVAARREMESWRILQLEPSALRQPDEFTSPARLGQDGRHLAATVHRLARSPAAEESTARMEGHSSRTCSQIAIRLSELMDDVRDISIDRDEKRELLTLTALDGEGTRHPARALSDGTLRFLALVVPEMDPETEGVLCLEEPENGIHPARIPAILKLLLDIAVDPFEPAGPDNPMRQVIINTHSPAVFQEVPDDSVVFVKTVEAVNTGERLFRKPCFQCLSGIWRARISGHVDVATRGELLPYLSPALRSEPERTLHGPRRVIDREDLPQFPFLDPTATP